MVENKKTIEHWLSEPNEVIPHPTSIAGLDPLSKGLFISALSERSTKPLLAVFATQGEARTAMDHTLFFLGDAKKKRVHYFPAYEFDFHKGIFPSYEKSIERNVFQFHAINHPEGRIFFTTISALLQKTIIPEAYLKATKVLKAEDEINRDILLRNLVEAGYQRQPSSLDPGVFSVRGGVIDIFCPLYDKPIRLEFWGDFIEEIRFFDPKTQRSLEKIDKAFLIPVGLSLVPHGEDYEKAAIQIKNRLDSLGISKIRREEVLESLRVGVIPTDCLYLFPYLSNGVGNLTDFFPEECIYLLDGKENLNATALETEYPKLKNQYALFQGGGKPIANEEDLFLTPCELEKLFQAKKTYVFENFAKEENDYTFKNEAIVFPRLETDKKSGLLDAHAKKIKDWIDLGFKVNIISHSQIHRERIESLFEAYELSAFKAAETSAPISDLFTVDFRKINLWLGRIYGSRLFTELKWVILDEEEIFGSKKRTSKSTAWGDSDPARLLTSFRDLNIGDYVVHREFGIGKYMGLKSMDFLGVPNDYVLMEYKDGDKLYIPVYRLNVLQKYTGGESTNVTLDKLGGDAWKKATSKAKRAIAELAEELLRIQAKRKLIPAHAYSLPSEDYLQFEMEFPFDETPDQLKAILDVNDDLSKEHPMDRLICGDVGYGKTEIAMRAAFRVVVDKKQVAVLVPTTVLAFQHFETFKKRFKDFPIKVAALSRLHTPSENRQILKELKEGKIDILIGTHRLISSDVEFQDLGLLVIDEEHRFGVLHKEKLKKMSESIHSLSMTATPIPRTLNMAMTGIKDISIIVTPPPDRLAVRTFICRKSDEVLKEAMQNELARGGQIFVVHNRIETIYEIGKEIKTLFPKIKFEVVHGQMDGEDLEKKMLSFYRGEFEVLLTTAIIESGLDVPNANTIIIDRADHFGLAQLYQLRGRVGRSEKRAYCYMLVPPEAQMTEDAKARLQVIQRYTDLGSGFHIASHDLELRGAGDLLGADQSGHLNAIGVDLYFELLEEALRELKGQGKKIEVEPEINLKISAYFPQNYLPDISERVVLYRRMSSAESEDEMAVLETEIRDRFGVLPEEVVNLLGMMTLKIHLKKMHVTRMSCGPKKTSLQFASSTPVAPDVLVRLVQKNSKIYQLTPDGKLVYPLAETDWKSQLKELNKLLEVLDIE